MPVAPTVLHVDDDPGVLDLSDAWFRGRADVAWRTTADPDEALSMLADGQVDCLVSDSLRLSDGDSFVSRAKTTSPDLPIVLFTASDHEDVDEAAQVAASRYVKKAPSTEFATIHDHVVSLTGPADAAVDGSVAAGSPDHDSDDAEWVRVGHYDWASDADLGTSLLEAVVDEETESDDGPSPALYEYVDAEALEELLAPRPDGSTRPRIRVQFRYAGRELAVTNEGVILSRSA